MTTQRSMDIGIGEVSSPATLKAAFAELLATALFVFMGVGSIAAMISTAPDLGGGIVIIAAAQGLAYGLLVASIYPISGGHINPAVSFAMIITGQISVAKGALYIVAQMVGAAIGMLLLKAFLTADLFESIPGAGGLAINDGAVPSDLAALGIEATIAFLLVWTIFAIAVSPRGSGNVAPLFIAFAVFVFNLVAIPLTGAGANPARAFGPELIMGRWDDWWIYYVGPLLGAAIAAIGYYMLYLMPGDEEPAM